MLGFIAGAFAWGALKAAVLGSKAHDVDLGHLVVGALEEELIFRGALERGLLRGLAGTQPGTANLVQSALFELAHDGDRIPFDAALGGAVYSRAADRYGILGSTLTHLAHNLGVVAFSR